MFNITVKKGKIYLIYGDGKGKTTFSLGLLLHFISKGQKAGIIQFMKGYRYSECAFLQKLDQVYLYQTGTPFFVKRGAPSTVDVNEAERGLSIAEELMEGGVTDLVILDEINVAIDYGLISAGYTKSIIQKRSSQITLVLTGRNPPAFFFDVSDVIIQMKEIKHPFREGIIARKGIDF